MTPEEKSVTRDWMLERGCSEEEIERALNPKFVVRLCRDPEDKPEKVGYLAYEHSKHGEYCWDTPKRQLAKVFPTYDEAFAMLEHYQGRNSPYRARFEYRPEEGWVEQL